MTATQTALFELTILRELIGELMFDHKIMSGHHSEYCSLCKRAHALGIKPTPAPSDLGLMCDIQRRENEEGDGYYGAFSLAKGGR